jgi:hypothetical protein
VVFLISLYIFSAHILRFSCEGSTDISSFIYDIMSFHLFKLRETMRTLALGGRV